MQVSVKVRLNFLKIKTFWRLDTYVKYIGYRYLGYNTTPFVVSQHQEL